MPEFKFKTLDEVPEELRPEAKQDNGVYVLNLVPNSKLVEFRNNNITLKQKLEQVEPELVKLKGIVGDNPDTFVAELTDLRTTKQHVQDGKLKGSDAIEAEVRQRTAQQLQAHETAVKDLSSKAAQIAQDRDGWKTKYNRAVLQQQITAAVMAQDSPANPAAIPDILTRAEALFHVEENGSIVPKQNGVTVYGSDGANPMSPKEWLGQLVKQSPYLGKSSTGGGANGNDGGSNYGMSNSDFQKLPPQERIRLHREAQRRSR